MVSLLLDSVPDPNFLQFGDTNPNDTEGIIDLISAGSHIVLFITGRGSVIAPLIKAPGNSETFRKMNGAIDFDAGCVLDGSATLDSKALSLSELVRRTAVGTTTKPEAARQT